MCLYTTATEPGIKYTCDVCTLVQPWSKLCSYQCRSHRHHPYRPDQVRGEGVRRGRPLSGLLLRGQGGPAAQSLARLQGRRASAILHFQDRCADTGRLLRSNTPNPFSRSTGAPTKSSCWSPDSSSMVSAIGRKSRVMLARGPKRSARSITLRCSLGLMGLGLRSIGWRLMVWRRALGRDSGSSCRRVEHCFRVDQD